MILICGIPNAGKTTYSSRYDNVIHFDEVLGRDRRDKVVEAVKQDNSVVVEGVYGKASERKRLAEASEDHNTCIFLDTPLEKCEERERIGRTRSTRLVRWAHEDFETPTFDEGWDTIITIKEKSWTK